MKFVSLILSDFESCNSELDCTGIGFKNVQGCSAAQIFSIRISIIIFTKILGARDVPKVQDFKDPRLKGKHFLCIKLRHTFFFF